MAREHARSGSSVGLSIAANLLQDAVEFFLLALADHANAQLSTNTAFVQYFDLIDQAIAPARLPFRARLIALNRLRVNAKHYAIVPAKSELDALLLTTKEFFEESCTLVLDSPFSSITLIELLDDDEPRACLSSASTALQNDDYMGCLVDCRKAFFLRFEKRFDVSPFASPPDDNLIDFRHWSCDAPDYARNQQYIERSVADPTDYIVIDHSKLNLDLVTAGVDTVAFWNIWRLTPSVFRRDAGDPWVIKTDVAILEEEGLADRAEYVLDATISILLQEQHSRQQQHVRPGILSTVELAQEQVPIRKRADAEAEITMTTPAGLTRLNVSHRIDGLPDAKTFWYVVHMANGLIIIGFLDDELVAH